MKQLSLFNTVNQSNELSQKLRYHNKMAVLTASEKLVVYFLVSLISPDDQHFQEVEIPFNDLCKLLHISTRGGNQIEKVKKSLEKLCTTGFWVKLPDGKSQDFATWLSKSTIIEPSPDNHKQCRYVTLKLHDSLRPYFLNIRNSARTIFQLGYVVSLKRKHACDIYTLCKSVAGMQRYAMPINELYSFLGNTYYRFDNVKKYVLDPCLLEINRTTDIIVDFQPINDRTRITHIVFNVIEKSNIKKAETGADTWKQAHYTDYIQNIASRCNLIFPNKQMA